MPGAKRLGAVVYQLDNATFGNHIDQIIALATRSKMPTIYPWREFTAAAGVASQSKPLSSSSGALSDTLTFSLVPFPQ